MACTYGRSLPILFSCRRTLSILLPFPLSLSTSLFSPPPLPHPSDRTWLGTSPNLFPIDPSSSPHSAFLTLTCPFYLIGLIRAQLRATGLDPVTPPPPLFEHPPHSNKQRIQVDARFLTAIHCSIFPLHRQKHAAKKCRKSIPVFSFRQLVLSPPPLALVAPFTSIPKSSPKKFMRRVGVNSLLSTLLGFGLLLKDFLLNVPVAGFLPHLFSRFAVFPFGVPRSFPSRPYSTLVSPPHHSPSSSLEINTSKSTPTTQGLLKSVYFLFFLFFSLFPFVFQYCLYCTIYFPFSKNYRYGFEIQNRIFNVVST